MFGDKKKRRRKTYQNDTIRGGGSKLVGLCGGLFLQKFVKRSTRRPKGVSGSISDRFLQNCGRFFWKYTEHRLKKGRHPSEVKTSKKRKKQCGSSPRGDVFQKHIFRQSTGMNGFVPLISLGFAEWICSSSLLRGSLPQVYWVDLFLKFAEWICFHSPKDREHKRNNRWAQAPWRNMRAAQLVIYILLTFPNFVYVLFSCYIFPFSCDHVLLFYFCFCSFLFSRSA